MPAWENFRVVCSHWSAVFVAELRHRLGVPEASPDGGALWWGLGFLFSTCCCFYRRKWKKWHELTRNSNEGAGANSWLWHSKLGVVGARKRQSSSGCWPNVEAEPRQLPSAKPPPRHSSPGGLPSSPMLHKRPLPRVCSSKMPGRLQLRMETRPSSATSWIWRQQFRLLLGSLRSQGAPFPPRFHPLSPFLDCTAGPWPV